MFSPIYTIWRYIIQIYSLFSRKGSVARFAEGNKKLQLIKVVIKAYWGALVKLPIMFKKRKEIWNLRRLSIKGYRDLLGKHRITAKELILRD
jgi:hypothetical protein